MPDNPETTRIAAAGRRFVSLFALSDAAKIASCYTDDAEILSANMSPVRGRAQIESVFKFTNRPELGVYLTQRTGQKILVHASPTDQLWGIGLAANDIRARKPAEWQGKNLLGFALMEVRDELRAHDELQRSAEGRS